MPLLGEVDVAEVLAGALGAGFLVFEGEEGGIADEECGVGRAEHGVEVWRVGLERGVGLP